MTPRARIEALEAQLAEAAASEAHNADTVWAVALGQLNELRAEEAALVKEGCCVMGDALFDLPIRKAATISPCGVYRYSLERIWDRERGLLIFAMLNPSTADADLDDPTIRRCVGFAKRESMGGIAVINLYAGRATKPADLFKMAYPHGGDNHHHWELWLREPNSKVVCAWGANARDADEGEFYRFAKSLGVTLWCLGKTKDGKPKHPLYLPGDAPLVPVRPI